MAAKASRDRIRRQDILNALGEFGYGLAMLLLLSGEWLLVSMLDDLVFHARTPFTAGWAVWIALMAVVTALVSRFIWVYRHGGDALSHHRSPAARARARRDRIVFALVLSAILIATYGARYLQRLAAMDAEQSKAAATLAAIDDTFERAGCYVLGADGAEQHDNAGYTIYGRPFSDEGDDDTQIVLMVDNEGVVFEVQYDLDVDPALALDENLELAEADLELMHAMVEDLDVPFEKPALSTFAALPEPFRQAFLEGSLYDEIIMNPNELENPDGVSLFACFWTQDEQDWSDAVGAYISLSLECE